MESLGKTKHLLEYWAVLRRRRWAVYLAVAAVTLAALVASFLATPLYRSTVTVQIERQNPDILTFKEMAPTDFSWSAYTDFYQTQYKILASSAVARGAAQRLQITSHPLYVQEAAARPSLYARLRALFPASGRTVVLDPAERSASWVRSRLEITPIRNSHLVQIAWVSPDPDLAAAVANAVADAYIAFNIESHFTASDQASEFLVNQMATLRNEIGAIETRLQDYGESKGIVSIDDNSNITLRALSDVAQRRTAAQTLLAGKQAAYTALQHAPADAVSEVLHSDLINQLKQEHASYEAQYSEKARLFKDDWPSLQTLRSKLDQARERLDQETQLIAAQVVAAARSEYEQAADEVRNLDALLGRQEQAAQRLKRDAVEFATLQSEVQKKREVLDALTARQNEMALSTRLKDLDATSSNVRVVDRARPAAAPFRPDRKLNLLAGILAGLVLGVTGAFFLHYLDNTITSAAEIERLVQLPTLAVIPHHGGTAAPLARVRRRDPGRTTTALVDLVAQRERRAAASEAYRELRTSILLSGAGHPPQQLMLTSALPEEGKSATAVNLAVVLAQAGRRVLLVDTDLRKPRLHQVFSASNTHGMSTLLSGLAQDPRQTIQSTAIERLDLLPSGPVPPNPSELLNAPVFRELGRAFLALGYDHVVYDSPPTLSVADAVIVASAVDATIVVVRAARTPREALRLAAEKLTQGGKRPIGVVLNDLDAEHHGAAPYHYYGRSEPHEAEEATRASGAGGGV